jgi:hypothetical protein
MTQPSCSRALCSGRRTCGTVHGTQTSPGINRAPLEELKLDSSRRHYGCGTARVRPVAVKPTSRMDGVPSAMRVSEDQILLFKSIFTGRTDVFGTYDPQTRRSWQVKKAVTAQVIRDHLEGRAPYGVYLLGQDRIRAVAADFDHDDEQPPLSFQREAQKLGLAAYIERSKARGFHAWIFLDGAGVLASKARLVVLHLLKTIQAPQTEVFPKQNRLASPAQYGNFINAPLFGPLVSQGRTVFLDGELNPYEDQWALLKSLSRASESALDIVIGEQNLNKPPPPAPRNRNQFVKGTGFGLPPCAQRMLAQGVTANQRVACFRLACQLRKIGFPFDLAVVTLSVWSQRNRPEEGKGIIGPGELRSQVWSAYSNELHRSCGCEDPAVMPFCDQTCPIRHR